MRKKVKPKKKTKSQKQLCVSPLKLKPETPNLLKLSVSKLAKLKNPQTKLYKAVLINNAFKQLQKPFQFGFAWQECSVDVEEREEKEDKEEKMEDIKDDIVSTTKITEESKLPTGILSNPVSPYSYNSFLSEVYTAVNNKFRRKISI